MAFVPARLGAKRSPVQIRPPRLDIASPNRQGYAGWVLRRAPRVASAVSAALLSVLAAPQLASAAGSGSFSPTASMGVPRSGPAAAALPNGRVLVAGGYSATDFRSSAEVFDPAASSFDSSGLGAMVKARRSAAVAPLPNGRVLIAGGYNNSGTLASAEVFEPTGNGFSAAGFGSMVGTRADAACSPLPDGRVLIAGGTADGAHSLSSAEVFDPTTNSFSSAGIGSMGTARLQAIAAPLSDGRVLIAGGYDSSSHSYLSSAEVFDPTTNSFSSAGIGSMVIPRAGAASSPLPDGRVLIAGGYSESSIVASAEAFNPATSSFSSAGIGPLGTARAYAAAAPLGDGRVLVVGGTSNGSSDLSSAEIFAATNSFGLVNVVKGKKLLVRVSAFGRVDVRDAGAKGRASAARKRSGAALFRYSHAVGGPGTIEVRLRFTRRARALLKHKGRFKARARIRFSPRGGLPRSRTAELTIKGTSRKTP